MKIERILEPAADSLPPGYYSLPHVLLVVDGLAGPMGGGERIAVKIASLLPEFGYRASILTFQAPTRASVRAHPPCPIYLLPLTSAFNVAALRAGYHLRRFLREEKVEIVQTFFESSDLWAGLMTKLTSSARLIWSRRDMGILRASKHRVAYRLMARLPDRVFAVSDLVRKHCIEVDRIDSARVETIYNGLDLDAWTRDEPADRSSGVTVITAVGNMRPVKGHDIFIRAAAQVAKQYPQTMFSIAGASADHAYAEELQRLVREFGLSDQFQFTGSVGDLRGHFAGADIVVLPSRSEGFSNAIVEAMAMSLPVVATRVGGNAEAVQDNVTGYIVPPENPKALAEAILRLLADPERAREMGDAGRQLVSERFTADMMMSRIRSAYDELRVAGRSSGAIVHRIPPTPTREEEASSR